MNKKMVEDIINKLSKIDNEYYNADVFSQAVYLYMRYGEIPIEIDNEKVEENIDKLGNIIKKSDTLMNENVNEAFEDLMEENNEKN